MAFLDDVKDWTDRDTAALALGRSLGLFSQASTVGDVKALLLTNDVVASTLYGLLDRLAWLGVLDNDEEAQRCRALPPRLHPLGAVADVPALEAGPPRKAHIAMSLDGGGFCLEADRAGFRFLGRVFEEIASSSLESGWRFARDGRFRASDEGAPFAFRLVDPV